MKYTSCTFNLKIDHNLVSITECAISPYTSKDMNIRAPQTRSDNKTIK